VAGWSVVCGENDIIAVFGNKVERCFYIVWCV